MPAVREKQRKLFGVALSMKQGKAKKTNTPAGKIASTMTTDKIKDFTRKCDPSDKEHLKDKIDNFINTKKCKAFLKCDKNPLKVSK